MVDVFKIINGLAPAIMEDFLLFSENTHNIRNFQIISNESKKTARYGKYETATSQNSFKTKIKTWKCKTCAYWLCQTYHQN